jgi:hypothetical protein
MAVLDQHLVSAGIKSRPDSGIYLIRQEPVHPMTVLNIFVTFVCAVLKEAESGDTFDISFNVDLQISYFLSLPVFISMPFSSSLSDLGYSLVVARVRAFFTEAQNHEERANMRYYKLNHPQSRPFVSPTGC